MCQSRRMGKPRTWSSTRRPLENSSAHAYREMTARPRPDSTACLIAPFEPSSIATIALAPAFPTPQRAALDATHLFDRHGGLVQHAEHPPRVAVKKSARLGELDALSKPVKQRQAKGFLELLDLVGD